jgi:hypothetical protein
MSFITSLFHRGAKPEAQSILFVNWKGKSGTAYPYKIHPIEDEFRPLPANYLYAFKTEDGQWVPIYIAQTRDLHQRLEGQGKLDDAKRNGATHIHVHVSTQGQAARCSEERDLVDQWQPVCNERIEN